MPCIHAEWAILGGRVRNTGLPVISGNTLLTVACEYCRRAPSDFVCHTGLAIRQPPCSNNRDIMVNRQQKLSNSLNYVICNNHIRSDWVLLYFTPVIQQNYHQPGRKFDKSFCAVDRLSYQLELSKSETSQFRSDLVFDIVNYVHLIFFHGR